MLIILEFILQIQAFREFGKVSLGTQQAKMEISKRFFFPSTSLLPPLVSMNFGLVTSK